MNKELRMKDKDFLLWVHARLRNVYEADENMDYMHKLKAIALATPEDKVTPNVITTELAHTWECESVDMYDDNYVCLACGKEITVLADDADSHLHNRAKDCIGKKENRSNGIPNTIYITPSS